MYTCTKVSIQMYQVKRITQKNPTGLRGVQACGDTETPRSSQQDFLSNEKQSQQQLSRISFKFAFLYFFVAVSPTILLLFIYEKHIVLYLQLVYQYTTFKN